MATKARAIDWGGLDLTVRSLLVNAANPGVAGSSVASTTGMTVAGVAGTGADSAGVLRLYTPETTIAAATADQLGRIDFNAPSEASGTDAILVAASIWAEAMADFTSTANETDLVIALGVSEAAAEKYRITRTGGTQGGAPVAVPDGAAYAVLAKNSGLLHAVPAQTAELTVTLPAAAAGLSYEFMYSGAAADNVSHIFVPTAGFYIGGVVFHDEDGDVSAPVFSDGNSNDVFTVLVPANYWLKFVSDGTNWYVNGYVHSATICTMADA